MLPLLKIFLFPLIGAIAVLLGVRVYRYFNEKIIGSRSLGELVLFALLMIVLNCCIVAAAVLALTKVYAWLS